MSADLELIQIPQVRGVRRSIAIPEGDNLGGTEMAHPAAPVADRSDEQRLDLQVHPYPSTSDPYVTLTP
jgi:hypothetical protein